VDPEALHGVDVLAALGVAQANALNDPGEVAQVEDVVGLGGRGQKVLHGAFVDGQGGGDDLGDDLLEGVVEVLGRDVPIQDLGEDGGHGGVIELVDGDEVEVAEEARRDVVASAAWWSWTGLFGRTSSSGRTTGGGARWAPGLRTSLLEAC